MMNHQTACSMTTNKLENSGTAKHWVVVLLQETMDRAILFFLLWPRVTECLPETKQSELVSPFTLCIKSLPYKFALTLCPLSPSAVKEKFRESVKAQELFP